MEITQFPAKKAVHSAQWTGGMSNIVPNCKQREILYYIDNRHENILYW